MPSRREFLVGSTGLALSLGRPAILRPHSGNNDRNQIALSLMGNRFVTHVSVISVDGVEVTRDRGIGGDVSGSNGPDRIRARRDAFQRGSPSGRMTWGVSWRALNDERQEYRDVRSLLAKYHAEFGDEITFFVGGYFSPMFDSRRNVNRDIHEALALISQAVGGGYRPKCIIAGFMAAENQRYLAEEEGIHVCQGQIWSQHAVDSGDGDGGVCYPYYPSREHYLKPAQSKKDFIDCVCLDGWTCDFLAARHDGVTKEFNSRMGCGPIETVNNLGRQRGRKEMLDTTSIHFDDGFEQNGFSWVTAIWEVSLPVALNQDLTFWLQQIDQRWPGTKMVTEGEFGLIWRSCFKDNSHLDYQFRERGTGAPGSEENLEIRWFMCQAFRLSLLRDWQANTPAKVIDFTRYDVPAKEPQGPQREWSLMNVINQKGTRSNDQPVPLRELRAEEQRLILGRYPELKKLL